MRNVYLGLDNGASGSLGIIRTDDYAAYFSSMPVKVGQDYTQEKKTISRIDKPLLIGILKEWIHPEDTVFCYIERPMINPARFMASLSAARALEACLIVLEEMEIPYEVIDSRKWQKVILPAGTKGEADLKQASFDVGLRLFPHLRNEIIKHNDADAILIAEYAKRLGI